MKDELQVYEQKQIVRNGGKMEIRVLSPDQVHDEMNALAKRVFGDMPELPVTLSSKQIVFLTSMYSDVMNVPKALKTAGITRRQLNTWMQSDVEFSEAYNEIVCGIKEALQSTVIKNAIYSKDSKLMIKFLESWFPETYARDAAGMNAKSQEQLEVAAMLQELRNGK